MTLFWLGRQTHSSVPSGVTARPAGVEGRDFTWVTLVPLITEMQGPKDGGQLPTWATKTFPGMVGFAAIRAGLAETEIVALTESARANTEPNARTSKMKLNRDGKEHLRNTDCGIGDYLFLSLCTGMYFGENALKAGARSAMIRPDFQRLPYTWPRPAGNYRILCGLLLHNIDAEWL